MAGVDLATVKELLGHKTLTMTLRYAHLAPGHKVKAMDVLAKELRDIEGSSEDLLYNYYIVKQGCRAEGSRKSLRDMVEAGGLEPVTA
jgi:hypothetical protein